MTARCTTRKKEITEAFSDVRGICIRSKENPAFFVKTFYDTKDNIVSKVCFKNEKNFSREMDWEQKERKELSKRIELFNKMFKAHYWKIIFLLLGLALFLKQFELVFIILYSIATGFLAALRLFIVEVVNIKFNGGAFYDSSKFHAAEHMAVNAYEKHNKIPTLYQIKEESMYSKNCGTSRYYFPVIIGMLDTVFLIILFSLKNKVMVNICIICIYLLIRKLLKNSRDSGLFKEMQFFFTNEPTDRELILAAIAVKKFDKMERFLRQLDFDYKLSDEETFEVLKSNLNNKKS